MKEYISWLTNSESVESLWNASFWSYYLFLPKLNSPLLFLSHHLSHPLTLDESPKSKKDVGQVKCGTPAASSFKDKGWETVEFEGAIHFKEYPFADGNRDPWLWIWHMEFGVCQEYVINIASILKLHPDAKENGDGFLAVVTPPTGHSKLQLKGLSQNILYCMWIFQANF